MAALPPEVAETAEAIVLNLSGQMQVLADNGDWAEVEKAALRLQSAILDIPETDRRPILIAVQASVAAAGSAAGSAYEQVSGRLTALRRGRVATEAYRLR